MINKREMLGGGLVAAAFASGAPPAHAAQARPAIPATAFGQVVKFTAKKGSEAELKRILTQNGVHFADMPECLGYVMSEDQAAPGVFWVTEFWASPEGHRAATSSDAFRARVAQSRVHNEKLEILAKTTPLVGLGA